jgi:MscS family membrane protein
MPNIPTLENNVSVTLDVMDGLNMGVDTEVQSMLTPLYEAYPFLANTIWSIPYANLIAATLILFIFLLLRSVFTRIVTVTLLQIAKKTTNIYDEKIIYALSGPLRLFFAIIGFHLFFLLIFKETDTVKKILSTLMIYAIFWAILNIIEASRGAFYAAIGKFDTELSREIGNFVIALVKILVIGVGFGAMLQVWGINVTALFASLGIGGLAFALAAKDTAANLFGSFSLLADKSIRIGEWIKVDGVEGTVENIGMRTTKIRSFQKSLITVPNHIVANNPIENFSRRGISRIKMRSGLTYDTNEETMNTIVKKIRTMLEAHPGISKKDTLLVNFESFGDSALNIFIYTFTSTSVWSDYLDIREDVNLQIMNIVEENGSAFAFPSQSIYVEQLPSTPV